MQLICNSWYEAREPKVSKIGHLRIVINWIKNHEEFLQGFLLYI